MNLTKGLNTLIIHAVDPVGNVKHKVYAIESKPGLTLVVVPLPAYVNVTTVEVVGMVESKARLTINGEVTRPEEDGSFRFRWELVEGPNSIVVVAEDFVGNREEVSQTVVLDTLPPDLQVVTPTSDFVTHDDAVRVVGSTEATATLRINGVLVPLVNGAFAHPVPLADGANDILLEVTDTAGNRRAVSLTVHREPVLLGIPLTYYGGIGPAVLAAVGVGAYLLGRWQRQEVAPPREGEELDHLIFAMEDLTAALAYEEESQGQEIVEIRD